MFTMDTLNITNHIDFTISMNDVVDCRNCEGLDCLPQRVLTDGIDFPIQPLGELFKKFCNNSAYQNNGQFQRLYQFTKKDQNSP